VAQGLTPYCDQIVTLFLMAGIHLSKAEAGRQSIVPSFRDEDRNSIVDAAIKQLRKAGFTQ